MCLLVGGRHNEHGGPHSNGFSGGSQASERPDVTQLGAVDSRDRLPAGQILCRILVVRHLRPHLRTLHWSAAVIFSSTRSKIIDFR